jgi:hypothetical protein
MVDPLGIRNTTTPLTQTESTAQTQQTGQANGPQAGLGVRSMDYQAGTGVAVQSAPQLEKPRLTAEEATNAYNNIMSQLMSGEDLDTGSIILQIQQLQAALDDKQIKVQSKQIESTNKEIQKNVKDQITKLDEAFEKMQSQKTWDTVKTIFTYAAMAIGVVAAIATGGALAIGVAVLGAAIGIAQQTGAMDKMYDAMGASQGLRTAINIGLSVVLLAGSITNAGMLWKGVGEKVTTALLPKVLQAFELTAKLGTALTGATTAIQVATTIAGGVMKVGEGVNQIGGSVARFEHSEIEGGRKLLEGKNKVTQQSLEELVETLKGVMKKKEESTRLAVQTVQGGAQTKRQIIRS